MPATESLFSKAEVEQAADAGVVEVSDGKFEEFVTQAKKHRIGDRVV